MLPSQPVVIIGAARSGTNMLRDALCRLDGVDTWPCDEINPVWRHGNLRVPHDAFDPELARPEVVRFVRGRFARRAQRHPSRFLVEKTCANALRVGFVHEILPEAMFLHIHRDGMDAVPSAMKRWRAPFDLGYTLRKARFVPLRDLPHYAARFLAARLHRLSSRDRRLGCWGPRFEGMDRLPADTPLLEVCARQWAHCLGAARRQLAELPAGQRLDVAYEDFVADPGAGLRRVRDWLQAGWNDGALDAAVEGVRAASVGRGRDALGAEDRAVIHAEARDQGVADRAPLDG